MAKSFKIVPIILVAVLVVGPITSSLASELHFNLGVEISGHVIPYLGVSLKQNTSEIGANLGVALPHDLIDFNTSDIGYESTVYYRYAFVATNFYPRLQFKSLYVPSGDPGERYLLLTGVGLQYLNSVNGTRFGGGLELNVGLPVSALDRLSGPIPYLSLESSYQFSFDE